MLYRGGTLENVTQRLLEPSLASSHTFPISLLGMTSTGFGDSYRKGREKQNKNLNHT